MTDNQHAHGLSPTINRHHIEEASVVDAGFAALSIASFNAVELRPRGQPLPD
jgi:hypothetical protein